jgi:hypothetical protein
VIVQVREYVAATVMSVEASTNPFPVIAALVPLLVRVTESEFGFVRRDCLW